MIKLCLISTLVGIMAIAGGYTIGRHTVAKDCLELRLTVINGQTYACKPHNPNPKSVL